jgi:hypothetical protein
LIKIQRSGQQQEAIAYFQPYLEQTGIAVPYLNSQGSGVAAWCGLSLNFQQPSMF